MLIWSIWQRWHHCFLPSNSPTYNCRLNSTYLLLNYPQHFWVPPQIKISFCKGLHLFHEYYSSICFLFTILTVLNVSLWMSVVMSTPLNVGLLLWQGYINFKSTDLQVRPFSHQSLKIPCPLERRCAWEKFSSFPVLWYKLCIIFHCSSCFIPLPLSSIDALQSTATA